MYEWRDLAAYAENQFPTGIHRSASTFAGRTHKVFYHLRRYWLVIKESLKTGAALFQQELALLFGLDSFRNHCQTQLICHGNDGARNGGVILVRHYILHKRTVNFQLI